MIFNFRQSRDLEIDSSYSGAKAGKRKGKIMFYWSTSIYTTTTTTHSATYSITVTCSPSTTYYLCGAQSARIDQNDSKVNNSTTIGFSEKIVKHGMSIYAQTKSLLIYVYSVLVEFSRILF